MSKLSVLLAGEDNPQTMIVKKFLEQNKIPHVFHEVRDILGFDSPQLPVCYVGQYQTYGVEESLKRIETFYQLTIDKSRQNFVI